MAERNTPQRGDGPIVEFHDWPVAANVKIEAGNLVVLQGGYARQGLAAAGVIAVGRAEETVDNTGGANGDKRVRVKRGCFRWNNSAAADQVTQADAGADCYAVNENTVAKTNGGNTRSRAGRVLEVDAAGVWVETY